MTRLACAVRPIVGLCVLVTAGSFSPAATWAEAFDASAPEDLQRLDNPAVQWALDRGDEVPSFVKHIVPLFNKQGCSARECHGAFQGQNGFRLSLFGYDPALDHSELTADEESGPRIDTEKPDASLALEKPLGKLDHEGGDRLEEGSWQHRMFRAWIAAGAKYDSETAPYLDRLEVVPSAIRLSPSSSIDLRTIAYYSDGTRLEATPLTAFSTNDESVAQVDGAGHLVAGGYGDTSIVAMYAGGVVTCQVIVPRDTSSPFPDYPPNSRVDELVAAKLRQVGVHPSELCDDSAFIRRAYVDTIGTLPTADEVRDFLYDDRADKRERLVDTLLDRPEYAIYWASIFSDWTGNNRQNVNNSYKVATLWHDWLHDKLERNVPYDELAGGVVTATSREGRPLAYYMDENERVRANLEPRDGFDDGTYARRRTLDQFWLKRMPDRDKGLAIRTANTFLGVQLQCAECHKHPFDRWTQADFEGFTSFFRMVTMSGLDGGEPLVNRLDYHTVAVYPKMDPRYAQQVKKNPPKILAGPVVPYGEDDPDPRIALWEWMRSPDNPHFAKNLVNRLWAHYFEVGIVDPVDDLNAANPPSNPPLFDWLATDFVEHGFDLKHLHRRILNSRTYQLSHEPNDSNRTDRRNFSHALVKRMPAEVALDAVAQVTGTELEFSNYVARPGTRAIGVANPDRTGEGDYFLSIFGRPKRQETCACERSNQPSLAQALYLINDADVHRRIADRDGRLAGMLDRISDDSLLIDELYLTCLGRHPSDEETGTLLEYVAASESREAAMQDCMWSLMNVREFLFVK